MCTNYQKQKDVQRDPALLMSQVDANQRFKATDISKQHGEDTLPGVLFKRFHHQLSQWFFVLMVKSSLLLHEPLKWRGCALAELYKGKGSLQDPESYRDVALADISGKAFEKHHRHHAAHVLASESLQTQFGAGVNSGATDWAHIYLRAVLNIAAKRHLSISVIFVDVVTAFLSAARFLLFDDIPSSMDAFTRKLQKMGFENPEIASIIEELQTDHTWPVHSSCSGRRSDVHTSRSRRFA